MHITPDNWDRAKELFESALELDPSQRASFLAENCREESLRQQVEKLLINYEEAGSFLDDPALILAPNGFEESQPAEAFSLQSKSVELLTAATNGEEDPMVGRQLGDYKLERRIAQGGMAAVFLASRADDEYRTQVAVKLVQPGLDSRDLLNRFRNERQTLAGLDHPNIVKLLDGGSTPEGVPFLVMDYVEGSPIDKFCDQHKLSIDERLHLFDKVCAAVQYAHQKMVIHRDLKPSNILVVADGTPKLLDFGIAKVLNSEPPAQGSLVTQTGTRCMTPAYASPEQMRGKSVTPATDIYSLGVVLYELLTGHRPYRLTQHTPAEMERAICEQEPETPSTAVSRVESDTSSDGTPITRTPELVSQTREGQPDKLRRRLRGDLDKIVLKALQKEPKRRYSSVQEFSEDIARHLEDRPVKARPSTLQYRTRKFVLRRKTELAAFALLLVLATGWSYSLWRQARVNQGKNSLASAPSVVQADGPVRSIAVLPLRNLSKDATQEQFANGVTEQLMTELSHVDGLRIASRQSVLGYQNSGKPATEIARELNVDVLVGGSVERVGDRIRVAVHMTDGVRDKSLWSKDYESDNRDALALQGAVAAVIAQEIRPKITRLPAASLRSSQPVNPKAQELLKKAEDQRGDHEIWLLYRKSGSRKKADAEYAKSISYLERAIREDPNYAPAYVALADQILSYPPPDIARNLKVWAALHKALALDETNPAAHLLMARFLWREDAETGPVNHYRRAIQLRPDLPEYHEAYAEHLDAMGRFEDAMKEHQMAQALDPDTDYLSSSPLTPFAVRLERTRRFMQSRMSNASGAAGFWMRGELEYEAGQYAEAVRYWADAFRVFGWNENADAFEKAYAAGGPHILIQEVAKGLDRVAKDHWMWRSFLINAHRYAGDRDGALAWLETAARECQDNWAEVCDQGVLVQLKSDYHWDPYRSDPRFQAIVRQVELGGQSVR